MAEIKPYRNDGGVFRNMDFAPYQFREFPKMIQTGTHGAYQIVNTKEEENELLAQLGKKHDEEVARIACGPVDPEKEALIARAKYLNVPINRKWSNQKLKALIADAEAEVDDLPPEGDEDEAETPLPETIATKANRLIIATNNDEDTDSTDGSHNIQSDEKSQLVARAKELGIHAATRVWGIPKLEHAIEKAERVAAKASTNGEE